MSERVRLVSELPPLEQAEHWKNMYDQFLDAYVELVDVRNREVGEAAWLAIGTRAAYEQEYDLRCDLLAELERYKNVIAWALARLSAEDTAALEIMMRGDA